MLNFNAESCMLRSFIKHIRVINAELAKRTGEIASVGEIKNIQNFSWKIRVEGSLLDKLGINKLILKWIENGHFRGIDWTVFDQAVILCQTFVSTVMDIRVNKRREVAW
jgi:hypothetical protein